MSQFLTNLEDYFGTMDLYEALGVDKDNLDREEAVQTAFDMKALRYHPNGRKYKVTLLKY